jgi:hypothetical protein
VSAAWRADFAAAPPFAHLVPWARQLAGSGWPDLARLDQLAAASGLVNARGLPVRFQAQQRRCGQLDYEAGILATGGVPTREGNWHDLLNALTWLAFPRTKAALNALQCRQLETGSRRGPISDAATLFDESGLVLVGVEDGLARLLAGRDWTAAFVARRDAWSGVRPYVIGHAVLEKLLAPWPGITAKCLFMAVSELPEAGPPPAWLDRAIAEAWERGDVARPADLFPVPVLGIPGWWPDNEEAAFYDNREVFRPARP